MKKGFITGILLGIICAFSVVYASDNIAKIKSAEYNNFLVFYDNDEIDLNGKKLVSIVNENENIMTNYMPLRAILESLGYAVVWDEQPTYPPNGPAGDPQILILTEEYLKNSDKWVNYQELVDNVFDYLYSISDSFYPYSHAYIENSRSVELYYGGRFKVVLRTAVIDGDKDKIYINKTDLDFHLGNWFGLHGIDNYWKDNTLVEVR